MKQTTSSLKLLVLAVLLAMPFSLTAQGGMLDPSFGNNGIVITPIGVVSDKAYAIITQPDGKIVAAGESHNGTQYYFTLTRYNSNGSLDISFSNNGIATTSIGSYAAIYAMKLQTDGKIVVAGYTIISTQFVFALARYNTNGSLDNSFGTGGIVTTPIGADDYARAVAIQSDGKIVVAGSSQARFAVTRYNTNGSLDASFGNNGIVITTFGTNDQAHSIAIQTNGKILIGGYHNNGSQNVFALCRYDTNGNLDATFGNNGISTTAIGSVDDQGRAMALQPDGKIIIAGFSHDGFLPVFALARFNSNGSLDPSFNNNGIVTTNIIANDRANALAIQADGKIVAAGCTNNGSHDIFALTRYNSNGSLDNSFGTSGIVTTQIGANNSCINSETIQSDGKIVVAGYWDNGSHPVFALARYNQCMFASSSQTFTICSGQSVTVGNNTYTTSGTYMDTLTGSNSCDSVVTTNLTVNPTPILTTFLMGTTIISNQNGATYQWIACNNNNQPIPGETNQVFTATVNGSYAVIVTLGTCSDTSACVNIFNVGIATYSELSGKLTILPNPFSSEATIQTDLFMQNAVLTVYNALGEQIKQIKSINGNTITLMRDNLSTGFYFIRLTQGDNLLAADKFVIID